MDDKEIIENAFNIFSKQSINPTSSKEFLQCAKEDLKASNLLYSKKIYALAVYHLQQAVEKIAKSYLLRVGVKTIENISDEKHHTLKVIIQLLMDSAVIQVLKPLEPRLSQPISKTQENAQNIVFEDPEKYANMSRETIIQLLNITNEKSKLEIEKVNLLTDDNIKEMKKMRKIGNWQEITDEDRQKIKDILNLGIANAKLVTLALITSAHEATTRYPSGSKRNPSDYTENMGIVEAFEEVSRDVEFVITSFEKMYVSNQK